MITKQDLLNCREQVQQDLLCFLDGMTDDILDGICQIVVDRFNELISKNEISRSVSD